LVNYNGKVYFTADDGINGTEIWSYNGAIAALEAEIINGPADANPNSLTLYNGKLYFQANDGI